MVWNGERDIIATRFQEKSTEAFRFSVRKRNRESPAVWIKSIVVRLLAYDSNEVKPWNISFPGDTVPFVFVAMDSTKVGSEFEPSYIVPDVTTNEVRTWGGNKIEITDESKAVYVCLAAKQTGVYAYTVDLIVESNGKEYAPIKVVPRRTVAFVDPPKPMNEK
jgi:hypothetical protein